MRAIEASGKKGRDKKPASVPLPPVPDTDTTIPDFCKLTEEQRKVGRDKGAAAAALKRQQQPTVQPKPPIKAKGKTATGGLALEFKARPGTFREKLLIKLEEKKGTQVSINDMCDYVYGNHEKANFGPLKMVIKGAKATIANEKLPYTIKEDGDGVGIYQHN